jgi:hypothetical protein
VIKPLGIRPLKSDAGQLVGYIAIENVGHLPAKNVRWFISIKPANGSNENQFPIGKHRGIIFFLAALKQVGRLDSLAGSS